MAFWDVEFFYEATSRSRMRWKLGKKPFPPPFLIPRAGLVTQAEVKGTTSTVYEATSPTFFSIQKMDAHFQEAGKCL